MQNVYFVETGEVFSYKRVVNFIIDQINFREVDGQFDVADFRVAIMKQNCSETWQVGSHSLSLTLKCEQFLQFIIEYNAEGNHFKLHFETDANFPEGSIALSSNDEGNELVGAIAIWIIEHGYAASEEKEPEPKKEIIKQAVKEQGWASSKPCGCPQGYVNCSLTLDAANDFAANKQSHYSKKDRNPQVEILQCLDCNQFMAVQLSKSGNVNVGVLIQPIYEDAFLYIMKAKDDLTQILDDQGHLVFMNEIRTLGFGDKLEKPYKSGKCNCHKYSHPSQQSISEYTNDYSIILSLDYYHTLQVYECEHCQHMFAYYGRYSKSSVEGHAIERLNPVQREYVLANLESIKRDKMLVLENIFSHYLNQYRK